MWPVVHMGTVSLYRWPACLQVFGNRSGVACGACGHHVPVQVASVPAGIWEQEHVACSTRGHPVPLQVASVPAGVWEQGHWYLVVSPRCATWRSA